jgi:arylsulfatase A-like enzyme
MNNVILLTIDALRADHMSYYGYARKTTPFLDSIKSQSITFTNCFSTGPYTQSSFPGILTSSFFLDVNDKKKLSRQRVLISEALKKKGVATAGLHSNPYLSAFFGYKRGWDYFYDSMMADVDPDCPYETARDLNKKAMNWLTDHIEDNADRSEKQPFFLWMHYMDVHEPYVPGKEAMLTINDSLDISREEMIRLFREVLLKRDVSDEETVVTLRDLYDAQILETDSAVKEFFGFCDEKGILDNTTILLSADHGDEFNEHGGLSHDAKMYNELLGVPLLIYKKGQEGVSIDGVSSTLDICPTIMHLFGLKDELQFQGVSLLPHNRYERAYACSEAIDKNTGARIFSAQNATSKLIYNSKENTWEGYNHSDDNREEQDITGSLDGHELKSIVQERSSRKTKPHEADMEDLDI